MQTIRDQADECFNNCSGELHQRLRAMFAEHSASGPLQSGFTLKRSVKIYGEVLEEALDRACDAVEKRIPHRGRAWKRGISDVRDALEAQFARDADFMKKPLGLTRDNEESAAGRETAKLMEETRETLRKRLNEFAEGWLTNPPKPWNERHPILWAMILLLVGAAVSALFSFALAPPSKAGLF